MVTQENSQPSSEQEEATHKFAGDLSMNSDSSEQHVNNAEVPTVEPLVEKLTEDYYRYSEVGKPFPEIPGDQNDFLINYLGDDDPGKPFNWPMRKRALMTCLCAVDSLTTVFGSAVIGPGNSQVMKLWHLGLPVATLSISLYVLGFALGPLLWGPMSEITGRKIPVVCGLMGVMLFAYACASAANFQTLVLCRFFAGVFGASTMTVALAAMSDLFPNSQRGTAVTVVSLMIFAGPMLAPVVGGYVAASFLGWRWTQYVWAILASLTTFLSLFFAECYPPKVLAMRAAKIRRETGNWAVCAPLELWELDSSQLLDRTILKPARMLILEPILSLISIYHGFIYGILYLCLEAVPIIFTDHYGWHGGNVYLPYLGMMVGAILSSAVMIWIFEPPFLKKLEKSPYPVIPEERLPIMMMCGIIFAAGIFLMCWSGAYHAHWFVPVLGTAVLGFGLVGIFLGALNYIIDTYVSLSGSALAANTCVRSAFACAFPLFVHPLFKNLGTQWAGTLLGCLASLLAPVPFVFYFFGRQIRAKSKFAQSYEMLEREFTHASASRQSRGEN